MTSTWMELTFRGGTASSDSCDLRLDNDLLSIQTSRDATEVHDPDIVGPAKGIVAWASNAGSVVVTSAQAHNVYLLAAPNLTVESEILFRDEDPDLRFMTGCETPDQSLLLLYERGMLLVRAAGTVAWHRLHDDLSAHLAAISIDHVTIESQWPPESAGKTHRYRLSDGVELRDNGGLSGR